MAVRDWLALAAGALLAGIGLGAWVVAQNSPPAPEPEAVVVTTTSLAPVETVVTQSAPPAEPIADRVAQLPASVSRLLEARGNLDVVGTTDTPIPESVMRVLIDAGAVLTVEEGSP